MRALCGIVLTLTSRPVLAGEARCWVDHGALVVAASFGDIAGDFILDASTPKSALHLTRAQGDGIDAPSATRRLVVAGERLPGFSMDVVDLDARTAMFDTVINGVIGVDMLRRFVVDIDFAPCRVRLSRVAPPRPRGVERLSIRELEGVPTIRASVSDGVAARFDDFAIDTGRAASVITGATLSRAPKPGADPPIRIRALALAGQVFEQTPAQVGEANSVGMSVWTKTRLRLDLRDGWIEVAPAQ